VSGQHHAPAALYPRGKSPRYPLYRRLGGPQTRSGRRGYRKNPLPLWGIEPRPSSQQSDTALTELLENLVLDLKMLHTPEPLSLMTRLRVGRPGSILGRAAFVSSPQRPHLFSLPSGGYRDGFLGDKKGRGVNLRPHFNLEHV
jgi:hypothetical protein